MSATPESFRKDVERFVLKLNQRQKAVFNGCAEQVLTSIKDGSAATGAPGQPVDTGFLKGSWQLVYESPTSALIGTDVAYAPVIEEGNRAAFDDRGRERPPELQSKHTGRERIKSTVGGSHSVKLTRQNFDRIAASVVREVAE